MGVVAAAALVSACSGDNSREAAPSPQPLSAPLSAPAEATPQHGSVAGTAACARNPGSIVNTSTGSSASIFNFNRFGKYAVSFDDWGPDPGTLTQWINGPGCWGVSTTTHAERTAIGSYPNVSRGWSNNAALLQSLSGSGFPSAPDWTTRSGMGIRVSAITKVHAKWSMSVPSTPNVDDAVSRWNALLDVYFHAVANPPATAWLPQIDLQIMQMLMDQPIRGQAPEQSGYHAYTMLHHHAWVKTIGAVRYLGVVDAARFNQPGGHTITMMAGPTMATDPATTGLLWGQPSMTHDIGGIVAWLAQPHPLDDQGKPITDAAGRPVTVPVIPGSSYLTAVNAGFEIDFGTGPQDNQWTTTGFWVAVQDEPDGP
jgi:hypothetical protein